jgi:UDP-N-acetyl-D-glucosamine dehydrogenase
MKHLVDFVQRVSTKKAVVGIVGLGYVGLPLAITFGRAGFKVLGLDVDPRKPACIHAGEGYLKHIPAPAFFPLVEKGLLDATTDFSRAKECDALIVCVPTPLTASREPDLTYVVDSVKAVAHAVREGTLFVLESTTYPGTTADLVRPILEEASGLEAGAGFFLAFSPEREDPGNPSFSTHNIPKIVGGLTPACLDAAKALYGAAFERIVPVSSTSVAEMAKLFENIYRAVNIALVNELKLLCQRLDMDVWEVISAAATKPFGFQAFWPGPGLGGHCIPIDPFYLTWRAHQVDMSTRFIELAGEINTAMPYHVVTRVQDALNDREKSLKGARVLVLGVAYKPDVDDMRSSPALKIIELLLGRGAEVSYHDPFIPVLPRTREYHFEMSSVPLTADVLRATDCVLVVTHHKAVDYEFVAWTAPLVVDTRHVVPKTHGTVVDA